MMKRMTMMLMMERRRGGVVYELRKERRNMMRKEARSCARFLSRFLFELPRVEETTVRVEVGLRMGVCEKMRRGRAVMMV